MGQVIVWVAGSSSHQVILGGPWRGLTWAALSLDASGGKEEVQRTTHLRPWGMCEGFDVFWVTKERTS